MISHDPKDAAPFDGRATDADAVPDAVAPWVFEGESPCGPLRLTLPREAGVDEPLSGVAQVLDLAQAEPLIRAVEQWLSSPWDPAPVDAGRAPALYRAVVRDPALARPGSHLEVPLAALHVPPPEALRAPALEWATHDATVLLGEVPPEALAQLQPGALLWLPGAFAAAWDVQLTDADRRLPPCMAQLDLTAQRLVVPATRAGGALSAGPRDSAAPQVVLSRPVRLPLDRWLGWGSAGSAYAWPTPQPWAAELRQGTQVLARGALMPMGKGCGLRIEALAQPAVAA
ncbi:hypothetical protein FVQ98_17720 [Ottowia sp. GY511]|uniref:Fumarylacetoacetase-like C-terminal domain-containing protein n=1 Tax=Ottowia flava TaxID=2675430 RepID=A0ABW4KZS5_9BURK|nr:hypothetical protein [Ottowia sp. GY511]TXK23295.1 hypothetical protein FVQ98_17720 [Ottowia sp. GY511]